MQTVVISGPPGSGKGTQAGFLAKFLGFEHISTGEILRREIEAGSELGILAKARIDDGNFVPDDVACKIISNFIKENRHIKGMVLDGFPRTKFQCVEFDKLIEQINIRRNICISIDVEENELIQRLLNRNRHSNRPDDSNIKIIKHRLRLYKEQTKPVTEYYLLRNQCEIINGKGSVTQVFESIKRVAEKYIEIK